MFGPPLVGYLMQSLSQIQSTRERLGRSALLEALQPGAPDDRAQEGLATAGIDANSALEAICGWRNGSVFRRPRRPRRDGGP